MASDRKESEKRMDYKLSLHTLDFLFCGSAFIWLYHLFGITNLVSFPSLFLLIGIDIGWFLLQLLFMGVIAIYAAKEVIRKQRDLKDKQEAEEYELIDE